MYARPEPSRMGRPRLPWTPPSLPINDDGARRCFKRLPRLDSFRLPILSSESLEFLSSESLELKAPSACPDAQKRRPPAMAGFMR